MTVGRLSIASSALYMIRGVSIVLVLFKLVNRFFLISFGDQDVHLFVDALNCRDYENSTSVNMSTSIPTVVVPAL